MKLAVTGKGGVGKTTVASLLAWVYASEGNKVIAIDANPDANLATALGISSDEAQGITPIAELKDLIQERTGVKAGSIGTFFKVNPKVDDIPEHFSVKKDGIQLLVMGTVKKGGSGCLCPEGALLQESAQPSGTEQVRSSRYGHGCWCGELGSRHGQSSRCLHHSRRARTAKLPDGSSYSRPGQRPGRREMLHSWLKDAKR